MSLPPPPVRLSTAEPPEIESAAPPPVIVSRPAPPVTVRAVLASELTTFRYSPSDSSVGLTSSDEPSISNDASVYPSEMAISTSPA